MEAGVVIPDSLLSVSRSVIIAEQRMAASLKDYFERILLKDEIRSAAQGYLLHNGLLVRKWPYLVNGGVKPVYQVVVPLKFRSSVLQASRDQFGHFGVHKTYDYVMRYFFGHA